MRILSGLLRGSAAAAVVVALAHLLNAAPAARAVTVAAGPGAAPYPEVLQAQLRQALANTARGGEPRTRHLNPDGSPKYTNRLILESSPYLQQHAHNPVDWYPWCDEAFDRARRENRPVLLSVGYSTCHWCHVMEEESFEDEEIARYLNEHYVAIKVDREQRPDIDGIYMAAVQQLIGGGGWPMTVWLTPDRLPFYGGTYFPPHDGERGVRFGFRTVLDRLQAIFHEQPARAAEAGADLARQIRQTFVGAPGTVVPGPLALARAYVHFQQTFDAANGGFGSAPKFPRSVELEFLLRYHRRTGARQALEMAERTLGALVAGGVYDHVGGGFHRYATDAQWRVPHFEKMLYDNALLVVAYLEAYQVTQRPEFAQVARETLAYIEREMTAPEGGFYSATDADSEGVEGKFFLWTPAEIGAALAGEEQRRLVTAYYGVTEAGNFEGKNVLYAARPLSEVAAEIGLDPARAETVLEEARAQLYQFRQRRVPPHTDRKILPAWNGLMISAFARAALVLGEPAYASRAGGAADFIEVELTDGERLRRSYVDGQVSGDGFLDDYAFLIAGLLDLYEATFEPRWLQRALALQRVLDARFWDGGAGGYFLTAHDAEALLAREKPAYDGVEPSGNSVALLNLLRLSEFTSDDRYRQRAEHGLKAFQRVLAANPASVPRMLAALDFRSDVPKEIVIVTPNASAPAEEFLAVLRRTFLPNRVLAVVSEGDALRELAATVRLVTGKIAQGGRATAYVCERQVCDLPTTDPDVFARQLTRIEPLPAEAIAQAMALGRHGGIE